MRLQRASAFSGIAAPQGCGKPILEIVEVFTFLLGSLLYMLLHYGTMTLSDSICCMEKYFDPFLTQNRTGTGSYGRKQRNACPANIGKQLETEPKRLRFFFGTTYGPEGRGFESLTACQKDPKP